MKKYDYLIVGSGLFGCTFAHLAHKIGKHCLVIEKRPTLGGNIYCENIKGINVHKYGAHIFHTSNKHVWDFVNGIVDFNRYTNSPIANYKGRLYNLPFNMNTFYSLWGAKTPIEAYEIINEQRRNANIDVPKNLEEQAISLVGKDIYEILIKGYTEKQWGRKATELPPFIIKRLPVRFIYDNNYFNDKFQGIPVGGFNALIKGLLSGIDTITDVDFFTERSKWEECADKIVFTGKIDQYYDYCYGALEYRTVSFKNEILNCSNYQGNAVINYTDIEVPYTRIIEHKHFELFGDDIENNPHTIISYEYPSEWKVGSEPYYPINDEKNQSLYLKYEKMALADNQVIFGGRLAEYRYYDMDKVIESAFNKFELYEK